MQYRYVSGPIGQHGERYHVFVAENWDKSPARLEHVLVVMEDKKRAVQLEAWLKGCILNSVKVGCFDVMKEWDKAGVSYSDQLNILEGLEIWFVPPPGDNEMRYRYMGRFTFKNRDKNMRYHVFIAEVQDKPIVKLGHILVIVEQGKNDDTAEERAKLKASVDRKIDLTPYRHLKLTPS